ncbi:uncharacterized protein J3D65DRAFT_151931 [Phyllosticta citribraziliensis]|uniref:Uncharacterized protein n=1 Tax=Phyllosticta citribraziliensis TaxID=989973 RepID=A0ABR1L6E2_9PEZI
MMQRRRLSKPAPLGQTVKSRSRTSLEDNEVSTLLLDEHHTFPHRFFRSHTTPTTNTAASPSVRRNKSAPSCFQVLPPARSAVSIYEESSAFAARTTSKKLQKKQPLGEEDGNAGERSSTDPTAKQTAIEEARSLLGFGPRETTFAVNDKNKSIPHPPSSFAVNASSPAVTSNYHPPQPSGHSIQHPINVVHQKPCPLIRRGTIQPLRRWKCCNCGVKTNYDFHVCSRLACGHERCEGACVTFEPT